MRFIAMLLLTGCANAAPVPTYHSADVTEPEFRNLYQAIVDLPPDVPREKFEADTLACNALADQYDGQTMSSAIWSGLFGAAVGAVIGAHMGDAGQGAEVAGETAAIGGAAQGMGATALGKRDIVDRCLRYRGYPVLGIQPKATPVLIMPME